MTLPGLWEASTPGFAHPGAMPSRADRRRRCDVGRYPTPVSSCGMAGACLGSYAVGLAGHWERQHTVCWGTSEPGSADVVVEAARLSW